MSVDDYPLAIHGAIVVGPRGRREANLHIRDGRIAHIGPERFRAGTVVDASGLLALPGMVDTHVHLMDPGPSDREDFPTGTTAAALAGVTSIIEHTHAEPIREPADLASKRAHLEGRSHIDYGLAAHLWPDRIERIDELWAAGVSFFKIFTCNTHGIPATESDVLLAALTSLASCGATALVHGEDENLTATAERLLRVSGRDDPAVITEWRSREAELVAVGTVSLMARLTGARITLAHVSNPDAVALIERERAAGADVAAEACPQYFLLREQEILSEGAFHKFTPPARARSDADENLMWDLLRRGSFSHLSTDHAPATRQQKLDGSIWDVHFGLPGLDTTLPLLLGAVADGHLAYEDVVRVYSSAPARRYGLYPRKGRLAVGADADIVLLDPSADWVIDDGIVRSKAGWTPYAGRRVRGRVVSTYLRGRRIADHGELSDEAAGRFLPGPGALAS